MSRRNTAKFGDAKGADLLAQLKGQLTRGSSKPPSGKQEPKAPALCLSSKRNVPFLTPDAIAARKQQKKSKAKTAKKAGVIVIKPRSAAEREAYRAALAGRTPNAAPAPAPKSATPDFGAGAFHRLRPLREEMEGFTADHRSPGDVPPGDRDLVSARIAKGAAAIPDVIRPGDGYYLGYDFGTSTTKVVARYPHGGVDKAFAIDVPPSIASDGSPHLFPTAIWWDGANDRFALTPQDGFVLLDSFKSALIHRQGHRLCKQSGMTMEVAATAFVALHVAYCIGAALQETADFTLDLVNVGIPVAAFEGQASVATFERALNAAMRLVPKAHDLGRADVEAALRSSDEPPIQIVTHAELSGAIAGYCSATRHYLGGHMIIDCGSATLDVVTFDLDQQTHWPIGVYGARVENLGADACALYMRSGTPEEDCRLAARYVEHLVYVQSVRARPNLFCYENSGYPYQIILVGGGIHSPVYAPFLATLAGAFEKPFHHPQVARTLRYDRDCDPARLILADGLARDPILLREIALPSPPPPPTWTDPLAPGPEQC